MFRSFAVLLIALLSFTAHANEAPDALVKRVAEEVLAITRADKDYRPGQTSRAAELAEATVLPHFDFAQMTQLATGQHWRQASDAQKEALTREFRTLLVRTYSSSLSAYRDQTIEVRPLEAPPEVGKATVHTEVIQPGGPRIPIDYRMERGASGWTVYDVAIDGVSLVISYRDSFNQRIRKDGIDGLVRTLQERSNSGETTAR